MGVYIEGMGFPCEEIEPMIFEVYADGTVYAYTDKKRVGDFLELKAVEVKTPHGRIADVSEDATYDARYDHFDDHHIIVAQMMLDDLPTIIEAEGEDDGRI